VVSSDRTTVVFIAPTVVAGSYDVTVFNAAGTSSAVLTGGLTYEDDAAPGGTSPGTGGTSPGTGGTTPGTGGSDGGSGDGATTDPGTGGGTGADGTGGTTGPVTTSGPSGQRLVRSAAFGSLGASFWSVNCSTSCRGVLL
jgi:hypothetical protein